MVKLYVTGTRRFEGGFFEGGYQTFISWQDAMLHYGATEVVSEQGSNYIEFRGPSNRVQAQRLAY